MNLRNVPFRAVLLSLWSARNSSPEIFLGTFKPVRSSEWTESEEKVKTKDIFKKFQHLRETIGWDPFKSRPVPSEAACAAVCLSDPACQAVAFEPRRKGEVFWYNCRSRKTAAKLPFFVVIPGARLSRTPSLSGTLDTSLWPGGRVGEVGSKLWWGGTRIQTPDLLHASQECNHYATGPPRKNYLHTCECFELENEVAQNWMLLKISWITDPKTEWIASGPRSLERNRIQERFSKNEEQRHHLGWLFHLPTTGAKVSTRSSSCQSCEWYNVHVHIQGA